jgi:hypothetical protein
VTAKAKVRYAALDINARTDASSPNATTGKPGVDNASPDQEAAIRVDRYDRTGNPKIDRVSDILFQTLLRDEELVHRATILLGKISRPLYGTLVHLAFAADVRWQDIPGIGSDGVEQSFKLGLVVRHGLSGSIRTDVLLRDDSGKIIAVWDVKTGNAVLTDERIREIQDELSLSADVPIFVLHRCRGVGCRPIKDLYGSNGHRDVEDES